MLSTRYGLSFVELGPDDVNNIRETEDRAPVGTKGKGPAGCFVALGSSVFNTPRGHHTVLLFLFACHPVLDLVNSLSAHTKIAGNDGSGFTIFQHRFNGKRLKTAMGPMLHC